jgi:hypothetical protein
MRIDRVPCPFVYSNGKPCGGHIVRVEAYKASLAWTLCDDSAWRFEFAERSHFHLFCSEKGNHAGHARPDNPQMKFHWRQLPKALQELVVATAVLPPPPS